MFLTLPSMSSLLPPLFVFFGILSGFFAVLQNMMHDFSLTTLQVGCNTFD